MPSVFVDINPHPLRNLEPDELWTDQESRITLSWFIIDMLSK
jgi:hypothetical protein